MDEDNRSSDQEQDPWEADSGATELWGDEPEDQSGAVQQEPQETSRSIDIGISPNPPQQGSGVGGQKQTEIRPMAFQSFTNPLKQAIGNHNMDLLMDVTLPLSVQLGSTRMLVRDILSLGPGSVIELDKAAGEPVDLLVNDKLIARGEVVVIDENFGIRVVEIVNGADDDDGK